MWPHSRSLWMAGKNDKCNSYTGHSYFNQNLLQASFYASGSLGVLWCFVCFALVTDDPKQNWLISLKEKNSIVLKRASFKEDRQGMLKQLMRILTIPTVWLCALDDFACSIALNIVVVEGPTFIKEFLGKDITEVSA